MEIKKLYRCNEGKVIGGIAMGLSLYFSVDVVIFRLLFVLTALFGGSGIIAYLIMWIVIPEEKSNIINL